MAVLDSIKRIFAVPEDQELVRAQARALSRQVPLMYAMVLVNTIMLTVTHVGIAPPLLTTYVPAALSLISTWRIASWWHGRHKLQDAEHARSSIKRMMRVMPVLSIAFCAWTIGLLPYGNAYQQSQVVFFCGITTIGCMFCLMHVRAAALAMGALTLFPFTATMLAMNNMVLTAIAINLAVVVVVMLIVLLGNYRDFSDLVASRSAMAKEQIETQRLSDENNRLANVDSLTNCPNRRGFQHYLTTQLESAPPGEIAVARLDLDSFKSINETFGQLTGNQVLVEVVRRVRALGLPRAILARISADNFALVVAGPSSEMLLQAYGDRMCNAMRRSFDLPGATIHLSASVGFAVSQSGDSAEQLYDRADYVASVAKRECRGNAVVFAERHERDISTVRRIEHELRTADLDNEIFILFQRQFDINLNCTTGYEVLARWRSPVLGDVSPIEFIPLAERIGLVSKVTQTVLRKALAATANLPKPLRLSVNLSANDVASRTAIETIVDIVEQAGAPCRIDFEITETAILRDMAQANESLLALLALGSRIALDDFGTGHSSLTHVQELPLDRIKIDRSFVADICNNRTSRAIIKTTIDLCRNLGISCVIEGVETQEQLETLARLGGTVIQGYLFGRPVDEASMHQQLADEHCAPHTNTQRRVGRAR